MSLINKDYFIGGDMNKINLLVALIFLLAVSFTKAQEDTTSTDEDWDWHWTWNEWNDGDDWNIDFGLKDKKPAITLQYGLAKMDRKNFYSKFLNPGLIEIKLGYLKDKPAWETDYIIKHSYRFLYLSNESNKLSGKNTSGIDIESDMWRFGVGKSTGYGYKLSESAAIILYNTNTFNWSKIDFTLPLPITAYTTDQYLPYYKDYNILNLYEGNFRFGTSSAGGIRIKFIDNVMLDAGYERSIVFQRHLFWKWAGSEIIEVTAQELLDGFINKIFKSSPAAGPIVNFILKNALSYGIYELRQDDMNWPFNTEAPIAYNQFKFGLTFVF